MKITNLHANLIVVIMWGFGLLIMFWCLYPYNPLEMEEPVKVLTPVVNAGDSVIVSFNFTKNTKITPEIHLSLVDGVIYNLPTYSPKNAVGHTDGKVVNVLTVPINQPCGDYHLRWVVSYEMNPVRTIEVEYESEKFRVNSNICNE